jgi:hypothetical protein
MMLIILYQCIHRVAARGCPRLGQSRAPRIRSAREGVIARDCRFCGHWRRRGRLARVFLFFLRGLPFHRTGGRIGWGGLRLALLCGADFLGDLARNFVRAPALHWRIGHFQRGAAGVDLVVMSEIGKAFEARNNSPFQEPRRTLTLPARHCELNGPNRVSLSPVSGAGVTVKPLSARTR